MENVVEVERHFTVFDERIPRKTVVQFSGMDAKKQPIVGVSNGEGPPVPIPNTEVKLTSVDNTLRATVREDRSTPTSESCSTRVGQLLEKSPYGGVAQLGEHLPCKQGVMGSNPIISTSRKLRHPRKRKSMDRLLFQKVESRANTTI